MFVLYGFVTLCSLAGISAGGQDSCGDYKPLKTFDMSRYMGTWYEHGGFHWGDVILCFQSYFGAAPLGKILVNYFAYTSNNPNSSYDSSREVRVPDKSKPGFMETILQEHKWHFGILATDYTSYSVYYECKPTIGPIVRIQTREPSPSKSVINEAMTAAKRLSGFSNKNFHRSQQPCGKSKVLPNNEKTMTKVPETVNIPKYERPKSQPGIAENEKEGLVVQRTQKKTLSINVDIEIINQRIPRAYEN